ncbi:FGGY-family carbohydrate kinase [Parablautia sp. Marseille-Q6255]|uniref:FGGY-family carbohydrate kinase n=1 Tax=Parablautia sp. Marseille-Q6255 TaxID=3039593 RepID=UPI002F418CF0
MKNYMVIDIGTGNSRTALVRSDGRIWGMKQIENRYLRDELYPDAQYFDPQEWKCRILDMCRKLVSEFPDIHIDAVTASGCRQSTIFLNKDGEAVYGVPNMDHRGREYLHEIPEKKMIYEKTGRWLSTFPAGNLYGLRKKRPDLFDQIVKFTSLSEWMGYIFTGKLTMELSLACETQLLDIKTRKWSEELFRLYQFPMSLAPDLATGPQSLGNFTEKGKRLLGVDYDVPFIVCGGDTQNAVAGAGGEVGDITIVSGTTSPLFFNVPEKFYDEQERCWVDLNIGGDNYFIETNPGVTGLNFQRLKRLLFPDISYDELNRNLSEKKKVTMCASFTTLLFDTGKHIKKGGFFMDTPWGADIDRYDFAAAVAGDVACALYRNYQKLLELTQHEKTYIRGCGGGFQSKLICQMFSDLTEKELLLPKGFEQASILGCVKLLNRVFGNLSEKTENDASFYIFSPSDDDFSKKYYQRWEEFQRVVCK